MKIQHSEEKIGELIKGKVWIDEIDQRCLFESDVEKLAKVYGSYMFLQGIEAAKKAVSIEIWTHHVLDKDFIKKFVISKELEEEINSLCKQSNNGGLLSTLKNLESLSLEKE